MTSEPYDQMHYFGVDVGTGSVRAAIFDASGGLIAHASKDISLFRDTVDHAEQSSDEIWQAVCTTCKSALRNSGLSRHRI